MTEPDGITYFYGDVRLDLPCKHSFLYVVWRWNEATPAFCGLCFLWNLFRDEHPRKIHEYKTLAVNGNPETKPQFISHMQTQMGLIGPEEGVRLEDFRRARKQYMREPSKDNSPATFALWTLFGNQPKMAKPLLMLLFGLSEREVGLHLDLSIYRLQTTVAKGIRTALRYAR